MKGMNRRRFLQVAGAGSIAVASGTAAAVPLLRAAPGLAASSHQGTLSFRAVTGLPTKTLPTYASYVLEGHVNLTRDIEAFFAQKYGTSSCRFQRLVPQEVDMAQVDFTVSNESNFTRRYVGSAGYIDGHLSLAKVIRLM